MSMCTITCMRRSSLLLRRRSSTHPSPTREPTIVDEHVHHHLHETIQPVIEKEVLDPSVTHKRVDVKENIQEQSKHHGVTTNSAISVDEFQKKLDQAEK